MQSAVRFSRAAMPHIPLGMVPVKLVLLKAAFFSELHWPSEAGIVPSIFVDHTRKFSIPGQFSPIASGIVPDIGFIEQSNDVIALIFFIDSGRVPVNEELKRANTCRFDQSPRLLGRVPLKLFVLGRIATSAAKYSMFRQLPMELGKDPVSLFDQE